MVAPAYLFACLILGGSAQGIWQNMVLQLAGIAIIAWAAMERSDERFRRPHGSFFCSPSLAIAVVAHPAHPAPATLWAHSGPRAARSPTDSAFSASRFRRSRCR